MTIRNLGFSKSENTFNNTDQNGSSGNEQIVSLGVNAKDNSCVSQGPILEGKPHKTKKQKTPPTIVEIHKSNILESSAERESSNTVLVKKVSNMNLTPL